MPLPSLENEPAPHILPDYEEVMVVDEDEGDEDGLPTYIQVFYNEEIREALSSSEKVRHTRIPTKERERNYLKRMNLPDARTYFRFRCKITKYIKGNRSSLHKEDKTCRYCKTGEEETQEHMEI